MKHCPDNRTCRNAYYIEELERVARAAAVILRVIKNPPMMFLKTREMCPHGNAARQPLFCDDCFLELEEALEEAQIVDDIRQSKNILTTRRR